MNKPVGWPGDRETARFTTAERDLAAERLKQATERFALVFDPVTRSVPPFAEKREDST